MNAEQGVYIIIFIGFLLVILIFASIVINQIHLPSTINWEQTAGCMNKTYGTNFNASTVAATFNNSNKFSSEAGEISGCLVFKNK